MAAALAGALVALNWDFLRDMPRLIQTLSAAQQNGDQTEAMSFVAHIFGLVGSIFLFLIPFFIALAAYEAACLRWMIRGEAPGLFGLTFNNDTWRVYGVYWCWLLTQFVVSFAISIVLTPVMFMSMTQLMASGKPDFESMLHWQLTVQLPLSMLQYIPFIFIGVRLAPAAATSVARRQFAFLDAWKVTRGRFLAMLGSFAVLWLIMLVTVVLIFAVTLLPVTAHMWQLLAATWPVATPDSLQAYFAAMFSPQTLMLLGIAYSAQLLVYLCYKLMSFGINARAALVALQEGKIAAVA